jgi:hypothetical protein
MNFREFLYEFGSNGLPVSRHFDELEEARSISGLRGGELLEASCALFVKLVNEIGNAPLRAKPLIRFPLGYRENLDFWEEHYWDKIGSDKQPPSIYLISLFTCSPTSEVYRVPIDMRRPSSMPVVQAFFESRRSLEDSRNGWEFHSDIYLFSS